MKQLLIAVFASLLTGVAFAQPPAGRPGPPPPAERWKHDSTKMVPLQLTPGQITPVKNACMAFYKELDNLMKDTKGEKPAKEKIEALAEKRNKAIRAVLTKNQQSAFATMEKELMPPPPGQHPGAPRQ